MISINSTAWRFDLGYLDSNGTTKSFDSITTKKFTPKAETVNIMTTINGANFLKSIVFDSSSIDLQHIKIMCTADSSLCVGCDTTQFIYFSPSSLSDIGNCSLCYGLCSDCFAPENGNCQKCISTPFILSTNSINGYCKCKSAYFFNSTSKSCSLCNQNSNCKICQDGYYLSNNTCEKCSPNCLSCDGYENFCITCKESLSLNEITNSCEYICPEHCDICLEKCYKCEDGYSLVEKECTYTKCSENCIICNPIGCLDCAANYFLVMGVCVSNNNCKNAIVTEDELTYNIRCIECENNFEIMNGKCRRCPSNCKNCSFSFCFECINGYALNKEIECVKCPNNCLTCATYLLCYECQIGYYLYYGFCYSCSEENDGCLECFDSDVCTSCDKGYFLDDYDETYILCTQCQLNCLECSTPYACDLCAEGLYWSENLSKCDNFTLSKCIEAASETECVKCPNKMYLSNGVCLLCISNCESCTEIDSCNNCSEGYYYNDNECVACPSNVQQCANDILIKCKDGWFMHENTCLPCIDNCKKCNNYGICIECLAKYFLNVTKFECIHCQEYCNICRNIYDCDNWEPPYYLNDKLELVACVVDGCIQCYSHYLCQQCNSSYFMPPGQYTYCYNKCGDECDECKDGECYSYIYDDYGNQNMVLYDTNRNYFEDNCKKIDEGEDGNCAECEDTYVLKDNECISCEVPNCIKCEDIEKCTQCNQGYYLNVLQNKTICKICSSKETYDTNSECGKCADNQFVLENVCHNCMLGCLKCINITYCITCMSVDYVNGFYFFQEHNSCIECPPGCTICSDSVTCYSCKSNYYLANHQCLSCGKYCALCADANNCIECGHFAYNNNGKCYKCPLNCYICNQTQCISCISNHYLISKYACKPIKFSEGCDEYIDNTCISCAKYNYLHDGNCYECGIPNCAICIYDAGSVLCQTCENGYYQKIGGCTSNYLKAKICNSKYKQDMNISNCCSSYNDTCFYCIQGYYLSNDLSCVPQCIPHCKSCVVPYRCTQCNDGYDYQKDVCVPFCTNNCTICTSSICLECQTGFKLEKNECISCFKSLCTNACPQQDYGCNICDVLMYVKPTNSCQLCNIQELKRNPSEFSFSLQNGKFVNLEYGNIIGIGYSGSVEKGYSNSICSTSYRNEGSIPLGKYIISDIVCGFNNKSLPRVLKLEPLSQFAFNEDSDSFYSNLYIYPDNEDDYDMLTKAKGENGIVANYGVRSQLTVGDTINVIAPHDIQFIMRCDIYPPPTPGLVDISYTDIVNEFLVKFTGWGGYASMTNLLKYEICIQYDSNCKIICESKQISSDDGFICNEANENKLGYFQTGGDYLFKFRVRYKGPHYGIYSEINQTLNVKNINFTTRAIACLFINETEQSVVQYFKDISLTLAAFMSINELRESMQIELNPASTTLSETYCLNGGTLNQTLGYHICQCSSDYYGTRCGISKYVYESVLDQSYNIVTFLSSSRIDWHRTVISKLIDSYFMVTAIPETITNDIRLSLMTLMINSINEKWSYNHLQDLQKCINGVLTSILYSAITEDDTFERRMLTENSNVIDQLIGIYKIYEHILNVKYKYKSVLINNETIGIPTMTGYILKNGGPVVQINETTMVVPNKFQYYLAMEYPYFIIKGFTLEGGYKAGSNAISFYDANTAYLISRYENLSVSINFTSHIEGVINSRKEVDAKCLCYDKEYEMLTEHLCSRVALVDGKWMTNCSVDASVCFVVYKLKWKPYILKIAVAIPACFVVIAIIAIIIKMRNHRPTTPQNRTNTTNK